MRIIIGISFLFMNIFNVVYLSAQANSIVYEQVQKEFSNKRSINTVHNLLYSTPKRSSNMLDAGIDNYKILNLNKELALSIIQEQPHTISIELKDSDNEDITLDLMSSLDVFSDI